MPYNNTDILFASLVGSKVSIPRFNAVQNELMKHVLPPIPFLPLKNDVEVEDISNSAKSIHSEFESSDKIDIWKADAPTPADKQFFPFWFVDEKGNKWLLPYEPMISISGKNTIIRRNVAKAKSTNVDGISLGGSIKERWTQEDYEITITGVLIGSIITGSVEECFPRKDFEKLRDIMTAGKSLRVFCEPLQLLGINQIVIEDFSFPFTKGENVQAYEIKAYSDFDYKLLLDIND
jgi:hypothetical protein